MHKHDRDKLLALTKRAIEINEELLSDEKEFIKVVIAGGTPSSLASMNEKLNLLCRKEHLYLSAAKFLLGEINKTT